MNKALRIILSVFSVIVVLCLVVFAIELFTMSDFTTKTHDITEEFASICVDTETADVTVMPATDSKCKVTVFDEEDKMPSVTVENGTLTIGKYTKKH